MLVPFLRPVAPDDSGPTITVSFAVSEPMLTAAGPNAVFALSRLQREYHIVLLLSCLPPFKVFIGDDDCSVLEYDNRFVVKICYCVVHLGFVFVRRVGTIPLSHQDEQQQGRRPGGVHPVATIPLCRWRR